jgi:hypothetical protein
MVDTCRNKYVYKDTNIKRKCTHLHVGSVSVDKSGSWKFYAFLAYTISCHV